MPPSVNRLRNAILDAIDAKDEAVRAVGDAGMRHAVMARSHAVLTAALPDATDEHMTQALASDEVQHPVLAAIVHGWLVADRHAKTHVPAIRAASPGADEGPIRKQHVLARRAARGSVGK